VGLDCVSAPDLEPDQETWAYQPSTRFLAASRPRSGTRQESARALVSGAGRGVAASWHERPIICRQAQSGDRWSHPGGAETHGVPEISSPQDVAIGASPSSNRAGRSRVHAGSRPPETGDSHRNRHRPSGEVGACPPFGSGPPSVRAWPSRWLSRSCQPLAGC